MIDKILITIKDTGEVQTNKYALLMEGENNSKAFIVTIPNILYNYSIYIEFEKSNGEKITSKRFKPTFENDNYSIYYEIPKTILNSEGLLVVQFVARNEEGVEWKTVKINFVVLGSINALQEVVEQNPDLLIDLQKQLDGKQDKLIAGTNIELLRQGDKVLISAILPEERVKELIEETILQALEGDY